MKPNLQIPSTPAQSELYVATTLQAVELMASRDHIIDGRCYRRLDPEYYAWIQYKMEAVRKTVSAGYFQQAEYDDLLRRYQLIQGWAESHFTQDTIQAAIKTLEPGSYALPAVPCAEHGAYAPHLFPMGGHWPYTQYITSAALDKVRAILEPALAFGWTEPQLLQNRSCFAFPCGQEYGLVCYIEEDSRIGEVSPCSIEIIGPPPREVCLRFYNHKVPQPWRKIV